MRPLSPHLVLGRRIEELFRRWLCRKPGVRILVQNFRCKAGEIDLIFEEEGVLVFLEIRARRRNWVSAFETVTQRKRSRILKTAQVFLAQYRGSAREIRFDLATWDEGRFVYFKGALS